jgi:muramoyltetrapeptide carboxypeptidase
MIFPSALTYGDKIAIITPSTVVREEYVAGAEARIRRENLVPVRMPNIRFGEDGSFAGSADDRLSDFLAAWSDDDIKAVLCARGGYGAVQLVSRIPSSLIEQHPKWLIGFSDISALHALLQSHQIASIHASMAKHLSLKPDSDYCNAELFKLLKGSKTTEYDLSIHPFNRYGFARGVLRGGNLAVLTDLSATPFSMLDVGANEDVILFIEDVAESISRVERMLWRMRLSCTFNRVKGVIFGQFTDYRSNANYRDMESMINALLDSWHLNIPVVMNAPIGHIDDNIPLVEGAMATLEVTQFDSRLNMICI